ATFSSEAENRARPHSDFNSCRLDLRGGGPVRPQTPPSGTLKTEGTFPRAPPLTCRSPYF
ncbi:hypothetical protein K2X85_20540, partial [bacterium]|nr:hypothetical protein [bacterium]